MAWSVRKQIVMTVATIAAVVAASATAVAQDGYRIVVNPSNPVSSLSRNQVSKLFLDKGTWEDGAAVSPVDLLPSSPVRDGFSREVLGLPIPAAVNRMRDSAQAAGVNPPPALATDREVLAYVRLKPGAIGYVSLAADVTGVKVVSVGGKTEHLLASAPAPAPGADPVPVGGRIAMPQRLVTRPPVYPAIAKTGHVQGVVEVAIVVDATGNVARAQIVKSIPQLDKAALDAVKQWKYAPTIVNGAAVPVTMVVQVTFTL
ncbi:MAG: TonB family protein [Cyanobacteria bacterium]|nr:TonB family protein [Cyanobacteriota bacterium]